METIRKPPTEPLQKFFAVLFKNPVPVRMGIKITQPGNFPSNINVQRNLDRDSKYTE